MSRTKILALLALTGCTVQIAEVGVQAPPPPAPPPLLAAPPPPPAPPAATYVAPPPEPPKPPHKKVTEFKTKGSTLLLPGPVVFETGSDKLSPASDEVLLVVRDYLEQKPEITMMRVEGHTDNDGTKESNQTLSEKRALAVARFLVANGIDCKRLIATGFGQDRPLVKNDTPDNKAQNRRVAFVNAALKKKPIGGAPVDGGGKVAGDACAK